MSGRYVTISLRTEDLSPANFMVGDEHTDLARLGDVTVLRPE